MLTARQAGRQGNSCARGCHPQRHALGPAVTHLRLSSDSPTPHSLLPCTRQVYSTPDALSAGTAALFVSAVKAAIARKGTAVVALSGGSLPRRLAGVAAASPGVDWSALHVFLADERLVPSSDPECSARALRQAFLDTLPGFPAGNLHEVAYTPGGSPADAANQYEAAIAGVSQASLPRNGAGMPVFDLILLGVGPDGHTASLFPNRSTLMPTSRIVLPVSDSPKPPPQRVTLSLSCINAAAAVAFVADGASKAEVLQRILEVQALPGALPAQMVRATQGAGEVKWLIDNGAASALHPQEWANPDKFPRSELPKK